MNLTRVGSILVICLLGSGPLFALQRTGIVERFTGSSTCLEGSHAITDPCTGLSYLLRPNPPTGLDSFLCTDVDLDGPDVGVECPIVEPQVIVPTNPACRNEGVPLHVNGGVDASLDWRRIPCATSYDVIRGLIPHDPLGGSIGEVTCLANDIPQRTNFAPTVFGPVDSEIPPEGSVFFYLMRGNGAPYGGSTYGLSRDGIERIPSGGDCPP